MRGSVAGHLLMRAAVWFLLALVIAITALWAGWGIWTEAYGSGPPYYGRTTNMDKWTSPLPTLTALGIGAFILTALCVRFGLRKSNRLPQKE